MVELGHGGPRRVAPVSPALYEAKMNQWRQQPQNGTGHQPYGFAQLAERQILVCLLE